MDTLFPFATLFRSLHDRRRVDDADRHAFGGAEGEILDRALRLRAPIGVGGNRNRAQRIGFGAGRLSNTASIRPALVEGPLSSCDRRSRVKHGASTSSDRKRTRLNSSHSYAYRMPSSA